MNEGLALGLIVIAAAVGGVLSWALGLRRIRRAEEAVDSSSAALAEGARSSAEASEIQDLIFSSMEEGVLVFDAQGRSVFANDSLARHLGERPTRLEALLPLEIQRAATRAGYTGAVTRAEVETGRPARWLRATAAPIGDDGSVLVVVDDVTEERTVETVRRDFVANASHELKTPAASIQAAAETLLSAASEDPAAVPRFAAQLEREAVRLSRIVADLLDLSRLEAGSDLTESVRLDSIVREEAQRSRDPAREAGIDLVVNTDSSRPVRGSARDLSLLVRNLLDNAVRYSRGGGSVEIRVRELDRAVALTVRDTGIGIPSRELPRIFERFYRVDRARSRETGGTGLGLAIVKHVAENHGGTVTVESELGRGTTFEVRLPISPK